MTADLIDVGAGPPADTVLDDPEFREQVLACYKPHCRYVQSFTCTRSTPEPTAEKSLAATTVVTGRCQLSVPEPCYINATGHLNAVDVGICFNQTLYLTLGTSVQHRWLPDFYQWSVTDFFIHQLPDVLIAETTARFFAPLSPHSFSAVFQILAITRVPSGTVWLDTAMECVDNQGGRCIMTANVAVVNA